MRLLLFAILVLCAPAFAEPEAPPPDPAALIAELTGRAPDRTVVVRELNKPDGPITRIFGDLFDGQPGQATATAKAFLEKYGTLLGFPPGKDLPGELEIKEVAGERGQVVRLTPARKKVPYPSGAILLAVKANGKLVSATGRYRKLENVQEGSLKAGDAVKRALSELGKRFPGSWLSNDGTINEYLEDGPGGTIRHVYDLHLDVGDLERPRHIVLGPDGGVLQESFGGEEERSAIGFVLTGYPNPLPPLPMPLPDLIDLPDWFSEKYFQLWSEHFQPSGKAPQRARAKNGWFVFPQFVDDEFVDTNVKIPDPRFLETQVYYHLTVARAKALGWGAREVDDHRVPYDVWVLPKNPLDNLHNDNAFFRPSNHSLNFAIWNPGKNHMSPAFDMSVIYHEYGHYVRKVLNKNAHVGGTKWNQFNARAVNEGFGDFFSSQITGQPHSGKIWKPEKFRSTTDDVKYCDVTPAYASYEDSAGNKVSKPQGGKLEIHQAGRCFSRLCNDIKAIVGDDIMPMLMSATRLSKTPATFENMCDGMLIVELYHHDGTRFSAMYRAMKERGIFTSECPDPPWVD